MVQTDSLHRANGGMNGCSGTPSKRRDHGNIINATAPSMGEDMDIDSEENIDPSRTHSAIGPALGGGMGEV